jgi:required for meiotic nuclear division protein 1
MNLEKVNIVAYKLGENIRLKQFAAAYPESIHSSSPIEVFIQRGDHSFISVQIHGEIAFSNCDDPTIQHFIEIVGEFVERPITGGKEYKEDFIIEVDPAQKLKFDFNSIQVPELNADVIKIVMLNVSQSTVLDYFTELSEALLMETGKYTRELELTGKLHITKSMLMKFIGKTLNTQSRIIDNLYFLDGPDTVWEDEYLSKINDGLALTFKLKTRFRELEYTLTNSDNTLRTLAQLIQNREGKRMELIIIFLILFEVLNLILDRVFDWTN